MKKLLIIIFLPLILLGKNPYKDWTVVLYMNGDNSLCKNIKNDIRELKRFDASSVTNFIIVYDCDKLNDSAVYKLDKFFGLIKITKKFTPLKEFDMGSYKFLEKMGIEIFKAFPSNKRMLVIWDHGNGWQDRARFASLKGISYDDQSGNFISTKELGEAIRGISKSSHLNILGFDACLMQMAEVIYEFAGEVDYTLGSEETIPLTGWDYSAISYVLSHENMNEYTLGYYAINWYIETNFIQKDEATLSMIDNKKFLEFTASLKGLVEKLKWTYLGDIVRKTPGYKNPMYKDLGTFLKNIPEAKKEYALYENSIVLTKHVNSFGTGMSIYLPVDYDVNPKYFDLSFSKDTNWGELFNNL